LLVALLRALSLEGRLGDDGLFVQDGNALLIARDGEVEILDGGDGVDETSHDAIDVCVSVEALAQFFIGSGSAKLRW